MVILFLVLLVIPYVILAIITVIIIRIIETKLIKSKGIKILIILIILLGVCMTVSNIKKENPSDLYEEMKEISDNHRLIGLSKEQVIELLGDKIKTKYSQEEEYRYYAGSIGKGLYLGDICIFFDCYEDYDIIVRFDDNDKVTSASMHFYP